MPAAGASEPTCDGAPAAAQGVLIRPLPRSKPNDPTVTKLVTMEKKLWKKADSWGPDLENELGRRNTFALVATAPGPAVPAAASPDEEEVVGYVIYIVSGLVSHISKVLVVPAWRRRGVGTALVRAAVAASVRERRVGSVTLHVDQSNEPAANLYKGLGFAVEGMLLHDYYSAGRHAQKMRLELNTDY